MALGLLDAGVDHNVKNKDGKTAYEMQSPQVRAAIEDSTLFCGRFEVGSVDTPDHATFTSVILRSLDKHGMISDIVLKVGGGTSARP